MVADYETRQFESAAAFRAWLHENQDTTPGVWLLIAKKGAPFTTVTYAEALAAALEYGWIDGQTRGVDEEKYAQKFTPRRAKSPWSVRNRRAAEEMIEDGRMTRRGLAEVERARADGRWDRAYEGPKTAEPHPEFLAALAENPAAAEVFETLNSQNRYAIHYRIQDAKRPETRARRIEQFVERLARGEKLY